MPSFLEAWEGKFGTNDVIVVQDGPKAAHGTWYSWEQIDRALGKSAFAISRRDSAIRSFGFLVAMQDEYDLIVTLDDDCLPGAVTNLVEEHAAAMLTPQFVSSLPGVRVRGLPYHTCNGAHLRSSVNIGLWSGTLDLDAATQLHYETQSIEIEPNIEVSPRVIPDRQYVPMCGMNLAFTRDVAPLMYFGLQGQGQPVGRFDDIWCGVLAKRICDHLGLLWTCGSPVIHHSRASDPLRNLMREASGVAEHESYWRHLSETPLTERNPIGCMHEAAQHIARYRPKYIGEEYFIDLARATETWAELAGSVASPKATTKPAELSKQYLGS